MSSSLLAALILSPVLAGPFDDAPAVEMRYTGGLTKANQAPEANAIKRFSLYALLIRNGEQGPRLIHSISERGAGGWSWPERYGELQLDASYQAVSGRPIRLLYDYQGNPIPVPLPVPVSGFADKLKTGARWTEGKETWEVTKQANVLDRKCWVVQASTGIGRKRTLWIDVEVPIVVSLEERVFVGQGDEHVLTWQLESTGTLDAEGFAAASRPLSALFNLQKQLQRSDGEFRPELSEAQLAIVQEALPSLQKDAADTPFGALVSAIAKDVKTQLLRTDEVARLADKFVGKAVSGLALTLADKSTVAEDQLKGKTTVLHFWEYQAEPLVEPYGQIGYLDFLAGKRRKLGVQVYGVAVDGRFGDPQASGAALKSVQKLQQFMNLSYGLALDDGKLLAKLGDPRKHGAKLPLWVVIGPDGKVAHYHAGLYKINPDDGLQQLDDVLVKLIREQKGK
jgi:hypothetical protein